MKKTATILFSLLAFVLFAASGFINPHANSHPALSVDDTLNIGHYKGKIVVLNFWASWSKASRGENKNLTHVYNTFRLNPKVVFVSVSLDTDSVAWKSAIDADELKWKDHFCDFKKYNSPVAKRYEVNTLPRFIILDVNGKPVHVYSNANQLEASVIAMLR